MRGLCPIFQTRACSLPPPPITSIFIRKIKNQILKCKISEFTFKNP
jgi:hypothetical protein